MRKRIFKRIAAVAATMVLTLTSVVGVSAAEVQQISDKACTVTIHMYGSNSAGDSLGTGTEADGHYVPQEAKPLNGVTLKYARVGNVVQYSDGGNVGIRYELDNMEFVQALGINDGNDGVVSHGNNMYIVPDTLLQNKMQQQTSKENVGGLIDNLASICTNETSETTNGSVKVNDLKGLYVFIGGKMAEGQTSQVTPFLVSAPMPNQTGDDWLTDIHVYPKVTNNPMSIQKTVQQDNKSGTSILVESGKIIEYKVEIDMPGGAEQGAAVDFESFQIQDTMASGLTPIRNKSRIQIIKKDGNVVELLSRAPNADQDIEIDPPTNTNNYTTTVTFTTAGLTKLNEILADQGAKIELTYKAVLGSGATLGTIGNKNGVKLNYQRENAEPAIMESNAYVHTYGVDLTKELSDNAQVADGEILFTLNSVATNEQGEEVLTPIVFTKDKNEKGRYWVVGSEDELNTVETNNGVSYERSSVLSVAAGGKLQMYGLVPGTYKLVETKSKGGYSILTSPITIEIGEPAEGTYDKVNPGATADGTEMNVNNANAYQIKVVNTKRVIGFALPKTGEAGTLVALAIGFGLVCFAVVMLAAYRTKNRKTNVR